MTHQEYQLEYEIFENSATTNSQIWFGFHGVGQNTTAFKNFAIQNNFKVYSFGLFYHEKNQSRVLGTRATYLKNWLILMEQFLENENINLKENSINIIGFSLGVRPALQFIFYLSRLLSPSIFIHKIILIAPETLAISNWYRLGTQTFLGKFIFKKITSSSYFKKIIVFISFLFFSKKAQQLIRYQIYNGLNSLASAWVAYRSFEIYGRQWREISEKQKGKIMIVGSKNDNFVRLKKIKKFVRKNSFDKGKSIHWVISNSAHANLLREFKI